ncbi:MAG: iron-containing alcohol dehydrogenase [Clostridia bacterium]|nr:iron-containing alcohol dehydrogenase [Clostridia bacterium]
MTMTETNLRANVIFGGGSIDALGRYNGRSIMIVTDKIMVKLGIVDSVKKILGDSSVWVYDEVEPDPTLEHVIQCCRFFNSKNAEVLVALGGGSAIDTAKAVILVIEESRKCKVEFVAVPTTSGTGSEVTDYTVISDKDAGRKIPLADARMVPDLAVLDYKLTKSVPPAVTAFTGMDVITHALEAYVARDGNMISDAHAEKALKLAFPGVIAAYRNGDDDTARENMMMASYLAGLAFTKAGLGICHSIAHAVGATFKLPHGMANAIALPHVVAFNAGLDVPFGTDKSVTAARYAEVARLIGLPNAGVRLSVQYLVREIETLNAKMGIPANLVQAGVSAANYIENRQQIIRSALHDMCTRANPVEPDAGDIGKLLDRVFGRSVRIS